MENILSRTVRVFACLILISGFLVTQSVVAQNEPQIKVGENSLSVKSGNQPRQYLLYIPTEYDGKTSLPLVLLFHGGGGTSKGVMELTGLGNVADKKKFIIAAPQGLMNIWNLASKPGGGNDDVDFVKDLIGEISSKLAIDKKRIYAAGFSKGAIFSGRLGCDLSKDIAAIGGVAGISFPAYCTPIRAIPVINFFGTEDMWYPEGDHSAVNWAEKNGCQKTPKTKTISNDVNQMTYVGCKNNAEVVIYRINGGGHIWPDSPMSDHWEKMGIWPKGKTNKDINATNLIWNFFEVHSQQ